MLQLLPAHERNWVATALATDSDLRASLSEFFRKAGPAFFPSVAPRVFLSHSSIDKRFVRSLARRLEAYGISVWLDEAELLVGDSLVKKLSEVIVDVDIVVAVLSTSSVKSAWVEEELHWAMTHQIVGKQTKVLPVVKEPCERPAFLAGRLFADFSTPYRAKKNLEPLVRSIFLQAAS